MPEPDPTQHRFGLREAAFAVLVAAWVAAVLVAERAPPLTPPVVPYGLAGR